MHTDAKRKTNARIVARKLLLLVLTAPGIAICQTTGVLFPNVVLSSNDAPREIYGLVAKPEGAGPVPAVVLLRMSDAKWKGLYHALAPLEPLLDFRRKDVNEESSTNSSWDSELAYMFGRWEHIEWLEIRAKLMISRGALLEPKIEDHTPELIAAVRSSRVPFELTDEGVRVWGYVRPGKSPRWWSETT